MPLLQGLLQLVFSGRYSFFCSHGASISDKVLCEQYPGADLDRAIGALLVERVTPETLALTLAVQEELVQRADEAQRLRHLQVVRAQYEAELAQRR